MKLFKYILLAGLSFNLFSCDESILDETPLDFLSPENSYVTPEHIEASIVQLYAQIRSCNDGKYWTTSFLHFGTDVAYYPRSTETHFGNYNISLLPTSSICSTFWNNYYKMIYNANVILTRIENIPYSDDKLKLRHMAEARFFRGYAYRCLVYLYGGVPLLDKEITSPRRDFVRATKEETLDFAVKDLEFAANNLPSVTQVKEPGRANNAAALHYLGELYLSQGRVDDAITVTSKVIDDPDIELMTERFGKKKDQEGDPYWDLFQKDNQNRSSGNKEGIFVIQVDVTTVGGGAEDNYNYNNGNALSYERNYGPCYWQLKGPDGVEIGFGPTTQEGGRPVSFIVPTTHLMYGVWGNGNWDKDVRNNERNIKRSWLVNNPKSAWFGKRTSDFPKEWYDNLTDNDTLMYFTPYFTKVTTIGDHPKAIMLNEETGEVNTLAGITYHDWYLIRVAETYLLRAEAYLMKGEKQLAANDINQVRNRAKATPVQADQVDMDYILDERMRELSWEEQRRITLNRTGMLIERTKKYNRYSKTSIQEKHNLFPIPYSEIERNTEAKLEQNPGY